MKHRFSISVLVFALATLIGGSASFAHEGHGGACAADMKKLCGDVKMGDHDAMKTCMMSHEKDLSPECKKQHEEMMALMDKMKSACKSDMDKLCKDVKDDDHHAMHECIMKNEDKLSKDCKDAHQKMMSEMHEHMGHHHMDHKGHMKHMDKDKTDGATDKKADDKKAE